MRNKRGHVKWQPPLEKMLRICQQQRRWRVNSDAQMLPLFRQQLSVFWQDRTIQSRLFVGKRR